LVPSIGDEEVFPWPAFDSLPPFALEIPRLHLHRLPGPRPVANDVLNRLAAGPCWSGFVALLPFVLSCRPRWRVVKSVSFVGGGNAMLPPSFGMPSGVCFSSFLGGPAHIICGTMKPLRPGHCSRRIPGRSRRTPPAIQISELLPHSGQQMDKIALVRSVTSHHPQISFHQRHTGCSPGHKQSTQRGAFGPAPYMAAPLARSNSASCCRPRRHAFVFRRRSAGANRHDVQAFLPPANSPGRPRKQIRRTPLQPSTNNTPTSPNFKKDRHAGPARGT